jgi:hypothetical protein
MFDGLYTNVLCCSSSPLLYALYPTSYFVISYLVAIHTLLHSLSNQALGVFAVVGVRCVDEVASKVQERSMGDTLTLAVGERMRCHPRALFGFGSGAKGSIILDRTDAVREIHYDM